MVLAPSVPDLPKRLEVIWKAFKPNLSDPEGQLASPEVLSKFAATADPGPGAWGRR